MYDVTVVGAGVIGSCIARVLSRYDIKVCVLEKEADIASRTTRANSAIVHAGFDAKYGSWKAKLNVKGNAMMEGLCKELDVPFKNIGSLVIASSQEELDALKYLKENGTKNGVPGLEIITGDKIREMEPNLSEMVTAVLYAPTAGIVGPYELAVACAENAAINGVEFKLETSVEGIEKTGKGFKIRTNKGSIETKYVINAAGLYADKINDMAGGEPFTIHPRKGEYCLLDKTAGNMVNTVIFQPPTKLGKGILVTPTVDGNLLIGPTAEDIEDKEDTQTTQKGLDYVIQTARKSVPGFRTGDIITSFAGNRSVSSVGDFIIEASKAVKGFINVAGIESPGLTASPAIAEMVRDILADEGEVLKEKSDYKTGRPAAVKFREMSIEEKKELVSKNPLYGRVICRCEMVTEGEIVDAIKRPIGATNLDAVKRRTRAGMGRCQGGFCSPRVVEILSRELGVQPTEVTKFGGSSKILLGKCK